MNGMSVLENSHLCQMEFVRWRKTHRKSRINKKWRKRYGAVLACKGHGYQMAGSVVGCPCFVKRLRDEIDNLAERPR